MSRVMTKIRGGIKMLQVKRSFIGFILVMVMMTMVFAGCDEKDPETSADNGTQTQTSDKKDNDTKVDDSEKGEEEVAEKEFYEFEIYWNYGWYPNENSWDPEINKIAAIIKDKFNVGFKVTNPSGDPAQAISLMMASNEYPDVVVLDRNDKYYNIVEAGGFLELDGYIEKYEGYRTSVAETTRNLLKHNGKTYSFGCFTVNPEALSSTVGFAINKKIYEDLGSPKLDTLDDLYDYLVMVRDADLEVEGQKVIPFQPKRDASISFLQAIYGCYGGGRNLREVANNVRPNSDGDKLELTLKDEKYAEMMVYLNKLFKEKLMSPEYFVETQEQIAEKLAIGRIAVYVATDVHTHVEPAENALIDAGSPYSYLPIDPPVAEGVKQEDIISSLGATTGWNSCAISKDAEKPERIFEYLDWSVTPEGNRLIAFGPKGYKWDELDENGYPIIFEGEDLGKTPEYPLGENQLIGNSSYLSSANTAIALRSANPPWNQMARVTVYNKYVADGTEFVDIGPKEAGSELLQLMSELNDPYYIDQTTKMIIAENEEEVLAILDETIAEYYRRGFADLEEYMTNSWKDRLERMGK